MSAPEKSTASGAATHAHDHGPKGLAGLIVGAIGVVFGDIGTSPLYTLSAALKA